MLHTKFRGNRPAGSGEDFKRVFTICGHGGHLGHVTSIMSSDFHFLVPESFHKLELMFMKHYAPNRCLYIKVAKLRTGVGSAEMSHLQNRCLKISG